MSMSMGSAQMALVTIFLVGLVTQISLVFVARQKGLAKPTEQTALITQLLSIYSVQLGVIIGGIFSQQLDPAQEAPRAAFWLAFSLSLVWNLLLLIRSISFALSAGDTVQHLRSYLKSVASAGSFLVAAAIAFFFTKH
jgi:hypothetical protein